MRGRLSLLPLIAALALGACAVQSQRIVNNCTQIDDPWERTQCQQRAEAPDRDRHYEAAREKAEKLEEARHRAPAPRFAGN
jgi:hypothetical protein